MVLLWMLAVPVVLGVGALAVLARHRRAPTPSDGRPSDGGHGPWMPADFGENVHDTHPHEAPSDGGGGAEGGGGD